VILRSELRPVSHAATALIICFDENDGFFDHLVPPTPPRSACAT
jgi:phospholipase C